MKVSQHFRRGEFACKCGCEQVAVDVELICCLEIIRNELNKLFQELVVIEITSGNRCKKHNRTVGGATGSKHLYSIACDFKAWRKMDNGQTDLVESQVLYDMIDNIWPDRYGLGLYSNRVHFDVRKQKARWRG